MVKRHFKKLDVKYASTRPISDRVFSSVFSHDLNISVRTGKSPENRN